MTNSADIPNKAAEGRHRCDRIAHESIEQKTNTIRKFAILKASSRARLPEPKSNAEEPVESVPRSRSSSVKPSVYTIEKSFATKAFIERYYEKIMKDGVSGKKFRRQQLEASLSQAISTFDKLKIKEEWLQKESERMRSLRSKKTGLSDFDVIQTLGHGGFGIVKLVKEKSTGEVFAMKMIPKAETIKRKHESHVLAERDLLSEASEVTEWIVKLIYSFQDTEYLYFVLEYMPGGDLLGLLIKLDIFEEEFAKRYMAEMILAIEEVHKMG